MYKIVIYNNTREKIDLFLEKYLESFLHLFVDSGISNVYFIEENYKKLAKKFKDEIYEKIKNIFSEKILPKKIGMNGELSVIISIGNFRLFIDYKENKKEKIRYIENIEFYKK